MELIHAKIGWTDTVWSSNWGNGGWGNEEGDIVEVATLIEEVILENFRSYNNAISLSTSLAENDFELELSVDNFKEYNIEIGDWIYVRESEFGGVVEDIVRNDNTIRIRGANFRGYLTRHIVTPNFIHREQTFTDYYRFEGDANDMLWELFEQDHSSGSTTGKSFDPFVVGYTAESGVRIRDSFRFTNYLSGVQKSLRDNGMRLETKHLYIDYDKYGKTQTGLRVPDFYQGQKMFVFSVQAKPITDYSDDDLFSQDYNIKINSEHSTINKRRFLWCLGPGEMEERMIVVLDNGIPTQVGLLDTLGSVWDSAIYDYPNAESKEELIKAGQERYAEMYQEKRDIEMFVDDTSIEFFLGDIIGGEDYITGISTKAEIVSKELNISNGKHEITYKIGGQ